MQNKQSCCGWCKLNHSEGGVKGPISWSFVWSRWTGEETFSKTLNNIARLLIPNFIFLHESFDLFGCWEDVGEDFHGMVWLHYITESKRLINTFLDSSNDPPDISSSPPAFLLWRFVISSLFIRVRKKQVSKFIVTALHDSTSDQHQQKIFYVAFFNSFRKIPFFAPTLIIDWFLCLWIQTRDGTGPRLISCYFMKTTKFIHFVPFDHLSHVNAAAGEEGGHLHPPHKLHLSCIICVLGWNFSLYSIWSLLLAVTVDYSWTGLLHCMDWCLFSC